MLVQAVAELVAITHILLTVEQWEKTRLLAVVERLDITRVRQTAVVSPEVQML